MPPPRLLEVNGWKLLAHPCFLDQLQALVESVEEARRKDPAGYAGKPDAKRLKAILTLALEIIPQDPSRADYRQGDTLGPSHKHWFRAKFFQHYRLFFRYDSASRVIIYSWVNDPRTKRAYGSKTDAYRVFRNMIDSGRPPDSWDALLKEAEKARDRLAVLSAGAGSPASGFADGHR